MDVRLIAFGVAVAGCSSAANTTLDGLQPALLDPPMHAVAESSASAASVWGYASTLVVGGAPLPNGDGTLPAGSDASCPTRSQSGNTLTLRGGCTDAMQRAWGGILTVDGVPGSRTRSFTADGWGYDGGMSCHGATIATHARVTGAFSTTDHGANDGAFHVEIVFEGRSIDATSCVSTDLNGAIVYDGTIALSGVDADMDGLPDTVLYNGSGRFGTSTTGVVSATTTDELIDLSQCSTEALAGTTALTAGAHSGVIAYDGATDCSPMGTVQYAFDGAAPATLAGVRCCAPRATASGGSARATLACALAAIAVRRRGASTRRRRRRA